jgi:hypothetical protein
LTWWDKGRAACPDDHVLSLGRLRKVGEHSGCWCSPSTATPSSGWKGLLRQHGLGEERLALLYGGMAGDERELLRLAFQKDPAEHPVRILLATDAASEGIDLQNHCHRLVNYDIPFNPNKLEQRIGRIDRYGQRHHPQVYHFVGSGWETKAANSSEEDLEFLSRVARKVATMEEDLGTVIAVLAEAVQRRMLGRLDPGFDVAAAPPRPVRRRGERGSVAAERNVRDQVVKLRAAVDETVERLSVTPANVYRVVATALDLARQQPLRPHRDERQLAEGLYEVPPLTGSWARTADGLVEPGCPRAWCPRRPCFRLRATIRRPGARGVTRWGS